MSSLRIAAITFIIFLLLGTAAFSLSPAFRSYIHLGVRGRYTQQQRLSAYGPSVAERLAPAMLAADLTYPPHSIALIAFKDARTLDLYARSAGDAPWRFIKQYPILGASGKPGPKLASGDRQVPEGRYIVESLNPNSRFHLSLRLNYPNAFDIEMADRDGRTRLGSDIMIHGGTASVGCLAMGDPAAEELFVLAAQTSEPVLVLISPADLRVIAPNAPDNPPSWIGELHEQLRTYLADFPLPSHS